MTKQKIRIDLARILETANVGIRRAAVFMGLGVNLASESTFKKYELTDEVNIQIVPSGANDDAIQHYKDEFKDWVIANGVRELIEAFSVYLDQIYHACLLVDLVKNKKTLQQVEDARETFSNLGFPNKLNNLYQKSGIQPKKPDYIKILHSARNCLTHRRGIVSKNDCNIADALQIKWLGFDAHIHTPNGDKHSAFDLPEGGLSLPNGGNLIVTKVEREITFKINSSIQISANALSEICWYMLNEAYSVFSETIEFMKNSGIKVNDYRENNISN